MTKRSLSRPANLAYLRHCADRTTYPDLRGFDRVAHSSLIHAAGKESAVDDEQVAGDKTRCLGGQENRGSDQFLDFPKPMHGRAQQEFLPARSAVKQRG